MPENQTFEMFELVNAEVSSKTSLLAFFAYNTDSHIGFEDHAYIVASIAH